MAQIKLKFSRLSIPEKIARARQIVTAMTGNAHFTTPQPPLSVITAAADELEAAADELEAAAADTQAARQTTTTKTTIQNSKEDVLDRVVSQEGGYVTATSGGDEAIIQSAGMDVRAAPGTIGIPSPPQALGATAGITMARWTSHGIRWSRRRVMCSKPVLIRPPQLRGRTLEFLPSRVSQ
jgi:hypothetical protein